MPSRLAHIAAFSAVVLALVLPASASAAPSPWWQVLAGSRPTNMWESKNQVQDLEKSSTTVTLLAYEGTIVACLGSPVCGFLGLENAETAAQLQADLEVPYGAGNVAVTQDPQDPNHFLIESIGEDAGKAATPLTLLAGEGATISITQSGGIGRLVVTATNLGNRPVDGTATPVKITDELPEGIVASGAAALAGVQDKFGPIDCAVEADDLVVCTFEGILPAYEAIEIEIPVGLVGSPQTAGAPGRVTVTGGKAPDVDVSQRVNLTPEPTPFGIEFFSSVAEDEGGAEDRRAGSHPYQVTNTIQLNAGEVVLGSKGFAERVEQPALPRNLSFPLPRGLIGKVAGLAQCQMNDFYGGGTTNNCPAETAIGAASVAAVEPSIVGFVREAIPVFNLPPAQGEPARFGFKAAGVPIVVDTRVDPDDGYRIIASVQNTTQLAQFLSATVSLWGAPGDESHDSQRGWACVYHLSETGPCQRPEGLRNDAFLRLPVSCDGPLEFEAAIEPWNVPLGSEVRTASFAGESLRGCNQIPFNPTIQAVPTSKHAESASGLDFSLNMPNANLNNPDGIAEGQAKKVEVTLPEGVTLNPSQANGLGACTPQQYAQETFDSPSGAGCPESSKVGSVDVATPLLEEEAHGSVYVAAPYDNPFDSLLGLYIVAKIPDRGVLIKQAGKVEMNPDTGQLATTFDNLPQIPFSTFNLHFNEGDRAPLVMPASCGSYDVTAKFTPWNAADPNNPQPSEIVTRTSSFTVDHGINGGPCPSGTPPFKPGFTAGTENNAAGRYSPLDVRLTRQDGEQEFTTFSLKMPEGVIGKLAGIPFCPDAAVAAARTRTGPNGGQEELDHASCPAASQIGSTLVGAGVGPTLTYAPGKLYLAGPYKGAKLSVVAITTAKVGPFDLGNVVIRQGLKVDPDTAQVLTDGSSADPIPHILQGIVVHARDIRINVDRKDFILNPTSCDRMTAAASVIGSGLNFGSTADDQSVDVTSPFQAADCARLGFKPKLALSLKGGIKRGANPRLKAVLTARKGDANIGAAVVKLPHSEFLEQGHIRTICTRVQFAAGSGNGSRCPKGSVYGRAKAISPLLDEPLAGPVYLRSSNHALPDLVAALHSKKVDINLDGRIDSVNGGIRNSFEAVPDAPVTKFVLEMQGGKKGLLVNSTNICQGKHRAKASFTGQNGKRRVFNPLLKARCGGKSKRRHKH
jgi:hypothetical protein